MSTGTAALAEAARLLGPAAAVDVPLGPLTTYRVGGRAALAVTVSTEDDLVPVAEAVRATDVPVLVVGKGSNMLVADAGFPGLAVIVAGPAHVTVGPPDGAEVLVGAGGAAGLPVVARQSAAAGLRGLEWAVGVPGSVGGAVRMNAGGHGADIASCLVEARVFDLRAGAASSRRAETLDLGYRASNLAPTDVVVAATFRAVRGERAGAEAAISEIVRWRRENQPGGQNAGSVFTNPPDDSAGRLVEAAGLKGFRLGTATVSAKHANFIQADEGGSADDVRRLMDLVRDRVRAEVGVELHAEVRLIGFTDTYPRGAR